MDKNRMSLSSRIIIGVASLILIAAYFFPVWFIFLVAPQYPEGLTMNIWLNKLSGQVDIINGLNHYIGMKRISVEMFPEFNFLVYIVGFYILFGLVIAVTGSRKLLLTFLILTIIGVVAAVYDFYKWGYEYGHNLDPKAAIQVPGLTYQPPLFGHKKLLNFDAYSYPDIGGWIVIVVASCFFLVWIFEWYKGRKRKKKLSEIPRKSLSSVAVLFLLFITSCSTGPEKFKYGKDQCADCSMTIMDPKFGAEIITKKGKVFKFDDAHCIANYLNSGKIKQDEIAKSVFINYEIRDNFLDAASVSFVVSPKLKSPMNSNAGAFASKEKAMAMANETGGTVKNWNELMGSTSTHQH